jgi:hypothetical protein
MRFAPIIAWTVLALMLGIAPGLAEKRVALVIGNGAYRNVAALANPANDANDFSASLQRLGFSVTKMSNASFDEMRRGLLAFGRDARGSDIAMVISCWAWHGDWRRELANPGRRRAMQRH